MWLVYLLKSLDKNWYYVGSTNDIDRRVKQHNLGQVRSTKPFIPLELVYKKEFDSEREARQYEQKLKQKRTEKEKLIKGLS